MYPTEPEEEAWAAFDAALRGMEWAKPDAALREKCFPRGETPNPKLQISNPETGAPLEFGIWSLEFPPKVLVVDDEPNIRRLVQFHLESGGYRVLLAADGVEALGLVETERPDLIVLDVNMPGPDGFRVLQLLKDDPATARIPVVLLTGRAGVDDIRHGSLHGADVHVTKPFDPRSLRLVVDRLAAVLGTPEDPPPLRRWLK